jgi:hypothetical protein
VKQKICRRFEILGKVIASLNEALKKIVNLGGFGANQVENRAKSAPKKNRSRKCELFEIAHAV